MMPDPKQDLVVLKAGQPLEYRDLPLRYEKTSADPLVLYETVRGRILVFKSDDPNVVLYPVAAEDRLMFVGEQQWRQPPLDADGTPISDAARDDGSIDVQYLIPGIVIDVEVKPEKTITFQDAVHAELATGYAVPPADGESGQTPFGIALETVVAPAGEQTYVRVLTWPLPAKP